MALTTSFHVQGMTCGGCEQSVARIIRQHAQVKEVMVDRGQQCAVVTWSDNADAHAISKASQGICASVSAAGFDCSTA